MEMTPAEKRDYCKMAASKMQCKFKSIRKDGDYFYEFKGVYNTIGGLTLDQAVEQSEHILTRQ